MLLRNLHARFAAKVSNSIARARERSITQLLGCALRLLSLLVFHAVGEMATLASRLSGNTPVQPTQIDPGGPEARVPVSAEFARVRDCEPGEDFPAIHSSEEQAKVKHWIERDDEWLKSVAGEPMRHRNSVAVLADKLLVANDWFGPTAQPERPNFQVRLERQRFDEMRAGKRRTRLPLRL